MTNKYTIVADGVELDTFEDASIGVNLQIRDILDVKSRRTSNSSTIILPGTPANNLFFKQIFEVSIDNISFNPIKAIPASIIAGNQVIITGNLQLLNISIENKEVQYEVVVTGKLKNVVDSFRDYNLRQLDLSEFNHTRDRTTIEDSFDYNVVTNGTTVDYAAPGTGYVYPYIINGSANYDIYNTMLISDMYPAVYVKTVLDKLMDFIGYTYTSDFFNSEYFSKLILPYNGDKIQMSQEEYDTRKLTVGIASSPTYWALTPPSLRGAGWWYNSYNSFKLSSSTTAGLTRESGTVDESGGEVTFSDESGLWTDDIFTCEKTGRYDIHFNTEALMAYSRFDAGGAPDPNKDVQWDDGDMKLQYELRLYRDGEVGYQVLDSSFMQSPEDPAQSIQLITPTASLLNTGPANLAFDTDTPIPILLDAENVLMNPGDKIKVMYGFEYPDTVSWATPTFSDRVKVSLWMKKITADLDYTKMIIEPTSNESLGNDPINMNQILPSNTKMRDFFMDIVTMFNLVIQDDPHVENGLIIEPEEDFFASKQLVLDWSKKLDHDSEINITPMSELDDRYFSFTYAEDDDFFNSEYTDETDGAIYGELLIDSGNEFTTKTNKTSVGFAATPNAEKYIRNRVAPFFVEKDGDKFKQKKVKPRILFYGGLQDANGYILLQDFKGGPQTAIYSYPYCGMWDHPYTPKWSLEFGASSKQYWDISVHPSATLYQKFHRSTIESITDVNSRLMEAYFHLTPTDISQFDFRDIILIDEAYWRVNKIENYNPTNEGLTKVVLYKLQNVTLLNETVFTAPTSNVACPTDMVITIGKDDILGYYSSPSGETITEGCCDALGGYWDGSLCLVPNTYGNTLEGANTTGIGISPTPNPEGPVSLSYDSNTINALGARVFGNNNYIPDNSNTGLIIGDNNSGSNAENAIIIGNGINARENNTVYIGNIKIDEDGIISGNGLIYLDGGQDVVFEVTKTNFIDVVDGGEDAVRNYGGDSKARPTIDGSMEP